MTTLVIAGHGRQKDGSFDPGATGFISKGEHRYMVEDLFPAMKKHLPKNANVVFYSEKKVSNHGNLAQLVKQYKAKSVIEFHYDAHTLGSSARGGHVIVHSNRNPNKLDLAIRDAIESMTGVRYAHKGQKGISGRNNLYNVNQASRNGIDYRLVELGFGTNKTDADIMIKRVDEYAKKLVEAITGSSSDKPPVNTSHKPKTDSKPNTSTTAKNNSSKKYTSIVDYLNDKRIDSSMSNRRKLAEQHGIKNYKGTAKQNIELLNKLQSGNKNTSSTKSASTKSTGTGRGSANKSNTVRIKSSATRFATGETIASFAKGKSYKIIQEKSDRVLLDGIMSWVYKKDLENYSGSSSSTTSKPTTPSKTSVSSGYKVGQKVTLKRNATSYATGERIPIRFRGKRYTIQQVGNGRVLLKELYSWVRNRDIQ